MDFHSRREFEKKRKERRMFAIRNTLNLLFMLISIVGVVWTFVGERETGLMIVLCSIPLKMTSTVLRYLKL